MTDARQALEAPGGVQMTAMDEWVALFASRDELAREYARLLTSRGVDDGMWPVLNLAIMDRWSRGGLVYIKRKAWALAVLAAPAAQARPALV